MALVNSICVNGRDVPLLGYFVDLNYHSFYILFFFFSAIFQSGEPEPI